jgi:hypothetical protein
VERRKIANTPWYPHTHANQLHSNTQKRNETKTKKKHAQQHDRHRTPLYNRWMSRRHARQTRLLIAPQLLGCDRFAVGAGDGERGRSEAEHVEVEEEATWSAREG